MYIYIMIQFLKSLVQSLQYIKTNQLRCVCKTKPKVDKEEDIEKKQSNEFLFHYFKALQFAATYKNKDTLF